MAVNSELPKIDGSGLIADAATLATGIMTLANNSADLLGIKVTDVVNYSVDAYNAGTANAEDIDLTASTLTANTSYSLSVKLPYVINFFGGGQETNAVYTTRTYTVYTDAAPTATELGDLFAARMTADLQAGFTATAVAGVVSLIAGSAASGAFIIDVSNIPGTTIAVIAAWVEPIGAASDVERYVDASLVTAATYDRVIIKYRKYIHHNAVKGLEVVKTEKLIVFGAVADAVDTAIADILDGTTATVADYLGAPLA